VNTTGFRLTVMTTSRTLRFGLLLCLVLAYHVSLAAPEGADPAINQPYLHPDFAQWVKRFESPGREVYD